MEQKTDVQLFDEAATQLEEALTRCSEESPSFDAALLSTCLMKMNTLKTLRLLGLTGPSFRKEVDEAISKMCPDGKIDEQTRAQLFETHIAAIDNLVSSGKCDETSLREAAIFMRHISVGIENYRIKVAQSRKR